MGTPDIDGAQYSTKSDIVRFPVSFKHKELVTPRCTVFGFQLSHGRIAQYFYLRTMSSGSLFVIRVKGSQGIYETPPDDRHWLHSLGTSPKHLASTVLQRKLLRREIENDRVFCRFRLRFDYSCPSTRVRLGVLALPAHDHESLS